MVFNNAEFGNVRTMEINGEPWFVGKDVCNVFGDSDHKRSLSRIDDEEKTLISVKDSYGRSQTAIAVNESGLYSLLFQMQPQKSNKKDEGAHNAPHVEERINKLRKFKHWVTSEILPTIRKTGTYSITQTKPDSYMIENPAERARRWAEEYEERLALECKIAEQQPKVEYHDAVLNKSGLMTTTAIAKDLGFKSAKQLNDLLKRDRVIYKKSDTYYLYADYEYLITEGYCDYKSYKTENSSLSLQWTEKGRKWLKERYCA